MNYSLLLLIFFEGGEGPLMASLRLWVPSSIFLLIFNSGGKNDSSISEILKLNKDKMVWNIVGNLNEARHGHSITTMRKIDVEPYCVKQL